MSNRVTSRDVARQAGVSQSTVSRVFGGGNVSDEKTERVMAAAVELGYSPNAIARSLTTQQSNIIGLVMANLTSPFYPYVLDKFLARLQAMDKQALLFTVPPGQDVDTVLPLIMQHRVDALIVTSATLSSEMSARCARLDIPVILFNRQARGGHASTVSCDNVAGGRTVADLLLDAGHKRLAYVAGTPNTSTNTDRERGFTERLAERGQPRPTRYQGGYTYESGYAAGEMLLAQSTLPDAIFCANDIMALGCIDAARDLGVSIPEALSVVGFDDIPTAGWSGYRLTTVRQEVDTMIDETMNLMQAKISDPASDPVVKLIAGKVVIRDTLRQPR